MAALCASCGIAEVDEIKLKECDDCDLVRYCSDECQTEHKTEHTEACKKRAAELRDELLFKKPESSHLGDCPLCCLPLPLDISKCTMRLIHSCVFCRKPTPETEEGRRKQRMKRVKANDPVALCHEGMVQYHEGDHRRAFEYWTKAAELGDVDAHFRLAIVYKYGRGCKDEGKEIYHMEEAAIGGHPAARHGLGLLEWNNNNYERAVKHWIISSALGLDDSNKELMNAFKDGLVSKDDLASALRAHQAAVDAMKSPQREAEVEFYKNSNSVE